MFSLGLRTNRFQTWVVAGTLLLQLAAIYWGPAQTVLKTEPLAPMDLIVVLLASTVVLWFVEAEKFLRRRRDG